jgi:F-type H+-transporting ATPase subunit delta
MTYNGITETVLTTAVKVGPRVRDQISKLVSDLFKTKVDLKENVDKSIIGGFILKVDDNYFDASVRNKLWKIRKELGTGGGVTD